MEKLGVGESLIMVSSCDSLASACNMCKTDESGEEYVAVLDVSKAAVVQRMIKWSGLKPVSVIYVATTTLIECMKMHVTQKYKWVLFPRGVSVLYF